MRSRSSDVLRRAFLFFYGIALLLGACAVVALVLVTAHLETLADTLEPLAQRNAAVLQDLTNAETGLRGYELTHQQTYLQPYLQGSSGYPADIAATERLGASSTHTKALIATEAGDAKAWIAQFAGPVLGGAHGMALDATGKDLLDRFRAANAAVTNQVSDRIAAARAAAIDTRNAFLIVLGCLLAVATLGGILVAKRLYRVIVPPLERVTDALLGMAAGDVDAPPLPAEGTDETRALADAANRLAEESQRRRTDLTRRTRMRELAHDVTRGFIEDLDLDRLLTRSVETIGGAFGVDRVLLRLADGGKLGPIRAEWCSEGLEPIGDVPLPAALSSFLDHLTAVQECFSADDLAELQGQPDEIKAYWDRIGARATVLSPIVAGGQLAGGLAMVQVGRARSWSEDEVGSIQDACSDLARAITNARLFGAQLDVVRQLEDLDRSKTDFISNVSHELRTPLTSIRGYLELLRDGVAGELPPQADEMLEIVQRNSLRLSSLVEDLLTVSRIAAGTLPSRREPIDLTALLRAAVDTVEPQARAAGVGLEVGELEAGTVQGDADQLERVFLNLLSNGIKFAPEGRVVVSARASRREVVVEVTDNGVGIPPEELEQIGSRFFRASNALTQAIPGTGLGLNIARALIERHGGHLDVASEPGAGSTFSVTLPLAASASAGFERNPATGR